MNPQIKLILAFWPPHRQGVSEAPLLGKGETWGLGFQFPPTMWAQRTVTHPLPFFCFLGGGSVEKVSSSINLTTFFFFLTTFFFFFVVADFGIWSLFLFKHGEERGGQYNPYYVISREGGGTSSSTDHWWVWTSVFSLISTFPRGA